MERFCELIGRQTFASVVYAMEIFSSSSSDEKYAMANCMIHQGSGFQFSPVHIIARDGPYGSLIEIVEWIDDIDVKDVPFGNTPLMAAMLRDQHAKVKFLVEKGANVNAMNAMGDTPSHIAVMNSFTSSFKVLLICASNLDAKTMYLGHMTSVHDMIVASPREDNIHHLATKYLMRTDRFTEELFGQYLLPLVSARDYNGIKRIFDIEDTTSSFTKTSALLVTYCIKLEMCREYRIKDLLLQGHLDAVRLHIVSTSQPVIIVPSPIVYEVVVSLYAAGSSISRRQLRDMINSEIENCRDGECLRSLCKLSRFANALLTSDLDTLPMLRNIAFAAMASIDETKRLTSLRQRIVQARLTRNWKLLLQK